MQDGRQLAGYMLAFDKVRALHKVWTRHILTRYEHMNLVLAECQESRKIRQKPAKGSQAPGAEGAILETEESRTLGLVILRGNNIVSVTATDEPPAEPAARLAKDAGTGAGATMTAGPGISKPAGRGAGISLQGPAAGVGGPGFGGPPGFPPQGFAPPGMPPGFAPGFPGRGMPPGPRMLKRPSVHEQSLT